MHSMEVFLAHTERNVTEHHHQSKRQLVAAVLPRGGNTRPQTFSLSKNKDHRFLQTTWQEARNLSCPATSHGFPGAVILEPESIRPDFSSKHLYFRPHYVDGMLCRRDTLVILLLCSLPSGTFLFRCGNEMVYQGDFELGSQG